MTTIAIHWFRRDLRISDNPALHAALAQCLSVIPVYVHAPEEEAAWPRGAASNWWLHHSLQSLQNDLQRVGSQLVLRSGSTLQQLQQLIEQSGATHLFWNRLYDPALIERDKRLKQFFAGRNIICQSFCADTLLEPWRVQTRAGAPFQVFTPFWRTCQQQLQIEQPLPAPVHMPATPTALPTQALRDLQLLPKRDWYRSMAPHWQPGEAGAQARLAYFCEQAMPAYQNLRDYPALDNTSLMSPHLHFGELSPRQLYLKAHQMMQQRADAGMVQNGEAFIRQIGWREFARHLLFHFPDSDRQPLREKFKRFPWRKHYHADLRRWQQGCTGMPIVDAGMRQLWQTGWMHNRVRMIVASFLTKNLQIHWLEGARWFWDTLIDADLANNTLGWQWVAGCGADAAPYFRIFNPVTQSERFDADAHYLAAWLPELRGVDARWRHKPWQMPQDLLAGSAAKDYPAPIVDLNRSRQLALQAYQQIK